MMSRHPSVKWAQRSDKIYITVELPDAKDVKLKLEPEGKFYFSAVKDAVLYEVDLELLDKINAEESKYNIGFRHIVYAIQKAETKWWSRLIKQEGKPPAFLKVDWDKWVDEDEENEKQSNFEDLDFSKSQKGMKKLGRVNQCHQLIRRLKPRKNPLNQWLKRLRLDCIRNR